MTTKINDIDLDALKAADDKNTSDIAALTTEVQSLIAATSAGQIFDPKPLQAQIDALAVKVVTPFDPSGLQAQITALAAELTKISSATPPTADAIVQSLVAAIAKGITINVTGATVVTSGGGTGTGTVPGTTTANPAVVDVNYFPENAADAPSPSPEDSKIKVINGKLSSIPYLLDAQGAVFKFDRDAAGNPIPCVMGDPGNPILQAPGGYQFSVNGVVAAYGAVQITVRQHQCWVMTPDGVTRGFERQDNPNAGTTVVQLPPIASAPAPSSSGGSSSSPASSGPSDPTPNPIAPGSSGKVIQAIVGGLAVAIASASAGDTVKAAPGTYNESVGISVPLLIDGGGKVVAPGKANATYNVAAILDATGVDHYVQGQGGFVALSDCWIKGWAIKKFGAAEPVHGGTGGFRNNSGGVFTIEDCAFDHDQMGIGPHGGDPQLEIVKNCIFVDCGLPQDDGYAHNIYSEATDFQGSGITSIVNAGAGGGHAIKSRAPKFSLSGDNYAYAYESSCIDLPDGTAVPFTISGGTVLEKKAGDLNTLLLGYGSESIQNGNAGGVFKAGATLIVPNDGRQYIIQASGNITFEPGCKFLFTDGSPVKPGTIVAQGTGQGSGTVTGLPA